MSSTIKKLVIAGGTGQVEGGGPAAGGRQHVSWVHHEDFVRAVRWLIERDHVDGPVNVAAPNPRPQREFARHRRPS